MKLTQGLALTALLAGAAAYAQTTPSSTSSGTTQPGAASSGSTMHHDGMHHEGMSARALESAATMNPTALLSMLHQVNHDEILLGQTAQTKASNDKVKDYAKMMVADHGDLDKKISKFATDNKLTLSASSVPDDIRNELKTATQDAERHLTSATGSSFDREYMEAMSKGHGKVLANLDAALPGLKDKKDQAKAYDLVKSARDKVEDHKNRADDILRDLRGTSATGGSGLHDTSAPSEGRQSVGSGAPGATTGTSGSPSSNPNPSGGPTR